MQPIVLMKCGGSLFDLPDLGSRLELLLPQLSPSRCVIVPGGGALVDVIRDWDRLHQLGEQRSHELAIDCLSISARFLAALSPQLELVKSLAVLPAHWSERSTTPVLDLSSRAFEDSTSGHRLPSSWDVTSDSLAAALAQDLGASRLLLLKSVDAPRPGLAAAVARGEVDRWFPNVINHLAIDWVNLRASPVSIEPVFLDLR